MEQTSQQQLQNKASEMIVCLELIKLNLKTHGESGAMANGKRKLPMWKFWLLKVTRISVNVAFWIFIIYTIFF